VVNKNWGGVENRLSLLQQIYDILKTVQKPTPNLKVALIELEKLLVPTETKLLQNYPNPFNPETWIPYQLASASPVSISIYNANGKLVRTLYLGNQKAGTYVTKDSAELENVSLTADQKHVLEQLKNLIGQQSLPSHTTLLQNYPNPFNPDTWLPYKLASASPVSISIYNAKGQLIRTLHLGYQNAGIYVKKDKAAYWDGKDSFGQSVASGVYYYTLQAGEFKATQKMVIMK